MQYASLIREGGASGCRAKDILLQTQNIQSWINHIWILHTCERNEKGFSWYLEVAPLIGRTVNCSCFRQILDKRFLAFRFADLPRYRGEKQGSRKYELEILKRSSTSLYSNCWSNPCWDEEMHDVPCPCKLYSIPATGLLSDANDGPSTWSPNQQMLVRVWPGTWTKVSWSITRSNIASVCVCRFIEPGSMSQTMSGQVWVMPGCYSYSPGLASNSHCSRTCCLLLAVCWAILAVISRCLPPTLPACPLTNCNCCAHTVMEPYLEM